MYGVIPYFVAKTMVELPLSYIGCWILFGVSYPFVELHGDINIMVLAAFGLGTASASMALCVAACVVSLEAALQFVPMLFIPQILFAGMFIKMSQIPKYLRWIQHICGLKYAMNIVTAEEFHKCPASQKMACDQAVRKSARLWVSR